MLPIVIALIALVAVIYWQGNKNKPKRYSSWKRVKGFTLLCQRAPGEEKAEALALLEWKKAPWRGKVAAVEKALYLLEKTDSNRAYICVLKLHKRSKKYSDLCNYPQILTPPLGISTVEQLFSWCFEVMIDGYGPGEYRPNSTSAIDYELIPISGLDGNKRERQILTASLKLKDDIGGQSLRPWQKIDDFTTNDIPAAFLVAV